MAKDREVLVANTTAFVTLDGRPVLIQQGRTFVRAGHPITVGREDMFEPVHVMFDDVEQATAAPGEKRSVKPATEDRKQAE